ncbi:MAG: cyclodeaminase/cyclohydrolase family protein [Gammaproteobacteria bacterium]|nr:cyclodeaminase/cyclohydrolase family protein [Gammaproteobacteria bacterium]MCY4210501.1 cyclodeaminase/cyclohydrolase family protein [Gammaproteobacteria bacterium]MCY4283484.1 cyclodeaminase/cyclohydrolase family protein [Gammaproteobacteria bacterium]MCY4337263.1 cyclodeaminase/cyclohydrolase family protein [Gammaproteobacteria bacterium]
MFTEQQLQTFLDQLASRSSTPGGGSAAAIMGAMGAALLSMVANLTAGKKNYAHVDAQMREFLVRSEALRAEVTGMVQADVEVFDRVMAAYGMSKETEAAQATRSAAIQAALKEATDVPLACAQLCADIIELCRPVAEQGNLNVISDAGVAVLAAHAALRSAALNVYINIGGIKDETFVNDRRSKLEFVLAGAGTATELVYELVKSKL